MNLLFVIGDISSSGGTERVTTEVAAALSDAGHQVSVLSLFGPANPWFDLPETISVKAAGLKPAGSNLFRAAAISRCLYQAAVRTEVDAVILVDSILFAFCVPWSLFSTAKIVCWEHFNLSTSHGTSMRSLARLAASRMCDKVVVLTERDAAAWRAKYHIFDRVQSIWNPIPRFSAYQSSPGDQEPRIALAVGRLAPEKGVDVLLKAWKKLGDAREGWVLRIVGGGVEEASLKALADDLEVTESVVFVGQVRDVAAEYRAASLYVMSSRWEGLPMTLLEAQHFGLPSVSTDCMTGPREVLSCNNGILVKEEDPVDLARGMARLMASPALRQEQGAAARENASRYATSSISRQWEEMLERLL
ncbi:glycosyltransferase family 4 protein [Alcanivorax sp. NBRC 102024]|uniref:glycosyltransferase family 4 protein n=1 Tax=Alcanivorax sp. NBRC 102024 TaxID=1113895 RepID=UPI0009ED34B5|nr:glycosyltransferase family 4 protein [Alcanivorax sp. NBRC 102024]